MKLMVFDVGGTEIKYSVMDEKLNQYTQGSVPTPMDSREHFFQTLYELFLPHRKEVAGIAMSLPGFIDTKQGRCNGGGALLYNRGQSIAPELSALCGCPVQLGNDGKCAALAELWKGALQGCQNASVFLMGTGVGGGLIIDGKLVEGKHFTAGEFSFVRVDSSDWQNPDTTMAGHCSTTALLERYRACKGLSPQEQVNGRMLFERYFAGEQAAQEALDWFCMEVAKQIFNLTILLDLERVAIGGGISKQPILIEKINTSLTALYEAPSPYFEPALPRAQVVPCHFSSEANQVGALYCYLLSQGDGFIQC